MPALSFEFYVVVGLCIVLAIVLRAYERLLREYKRIQFERKEIENKARNHAGKIIEGAKDRALAILEEAGIQATEKKGEMASKLDEVTGKQLDQYKNTIQNVSKDIKEQALREMREFSSTLDERIDEQYTQIQKDIDSYREEKMNEMKTKLSGLVEDIIPAAIGKGLNYEAQEQMIFNALEEAKEKHVI